MLRASPSRPDSSGKRCPQAPPLKRLGGAGLTLKVQLGIPLTPTCQSHYFKIGRKTIFFFLFKNVMMSRQGAVESLTVLS